MAQTLAKIDFGSRVRMISGRTLTTINDYWYIIATESSDVAATNVTCTNLRMAGCCLGTDRRDFSWNKACFTHWAAPNWKISLFAAMPGGHEIDGRPLSGASSRETLVALWIFFNDKNGEIKQGRIYWIKFSSAYDQTIKRSRVSLPQVGRVQLVAGEDDVRRRRLLLPLAKLLQRLQRRVGARHVLHHRLLGHFLHPLLRLHLAGPLPVEAVAQVTERLLRVQHPAVVVDVVQLEKKLSRQKPKFSVDNFRGKSHRPLSSQL